MQTLTHSALNAGQVRWPEHMARALELAALVLHAAPNPRVGCVLVAGAATPMDDPIAEGWHRGAGLPHAEPEALAAAGDHAKGATVFVTLEPCCHTGKTGPCSSALIAAGVAQVVIASRDPNPKVSGGGIAALESAGIPVFFLSDLEPAARRLNRGFYSRLERGRPFVRCKLAMSLDGRTGLANGESKWITGPAARADVQLLRAQCDAVLTGIETVLADDPALTVREDSLPLTAEARQHTANSLAQQPLRVVLDSRSRLHPRSKIVTGEGRCVAYGIEANQGIEPEAGELFERRLCPRNADSGRVELASVLDSLALQDECNELLVEAGATLSGAFIEAGLVDELIVYIAPKLLGSDARPLLGFAGLTQMSEAWQLSIESVTQIETDLRVVLTPTA